MDHLFTMEDAARRLGVQYPEKPHHMLVMVQRGPSDYDVYCVNPVVLQEKLGIQDGHALWLELGQNIAITKREMDQFRFSHPVVLQRTGESVSIAGIPSHVYKVHRLLSIQASPFKAEFKKAWDLLTQVEQAHEYHDARRIVGRSQHGLFDAFVRSLPEISCRGITLWTNIEGHCYFNAAFAMFFVPHLMELGKDSEFWKYIFLYTSQEVSDQTSLSYFFRFRLELMLLIHQMLNPSPIKTCSDILDSWNAWATYLGPVEPERIGYIPPSASRRLYIPHSTNQYELLKKVLGRDPILEPGGYSEAIVVALVRTFFPRREFDRPLPPPVPSFINYFFGIHTEPVNFAFVRAKPQQTSAYLTFYAYVQRKALLYGVSHEIISLLTNIETESHKETHPSTFPLVPPAKYGNELNARELGLNMDPPLLPEQLHPHIISMALEIRTWSTKEGPGGHALAMVRCQDRWYVYCDNCGPVLVSARMYLQSMLHLPLTDQDPTDTLEQILRYMQLYVNVSVIQYQQVAGFQE